VAQPADEAGHDKGGGAGHGEGPTVSGMHVSIFGRPVASVQATVGEAEAKLF
jgi:hypothetical protein